MVGYDQKNRDLENLNHAENVTSHKIPPHTFKSLASKGGKNEVTCCTRTVILIDVNITSLYHHGNDSIRQFSQWVPKQLDAVQNADRTWSTDPCSLQTRGDAS